MADGNENKIYVGSLSYGTTKESLTNYFNSVAGEVIDARVITDRESGKSRGFGFVTFQDSASFSKAMALSQPSLDGRDIQVSKANSPAGRGGGGGGYGRGRSGGYGGGGSYGGRGGGRGYGSGGVGYGYGNYGGGGGACGGGGGSYGQSYGTGNWQ